MVLPSKEHSAMCSCLGVKYHCCPTAKGHTLFPACKGSVLKDGPFFLSLFLSDGDFADSCKETASFNSPHLPRDVWLCRTFFFPFALQPVLLSEDLFKFAQKCPLGILFL